MLIIENCRLAQPAHVFGQRQWAWMWVVMRHNQEHTYIGTGRRKVVKLYCVQRYSTISTNSFVILLSKVTQGKLHYYHYGPRTVQYTVVDVSCSCVLNAHQQIQLMNHLPHPKRFHPSGLPLAERWIVLAK